MQLNKIYHGDARKMEKIADSSVDLIITSPPYNVGKEYEDSLTDAQYKRFLYDAFEECRRVMKDDARICINITGSGRNPYKPLHHWVGAIMDRLKFVMRGDIVWDKGASGRGGTAWGSWKSASNPTLRDNHEFILVYSKKDMKKEAKGEDTISPLDFTRATAGMWRIQTESSNIGHPAPFPVQLPLRLMELYSFKDEVVLDPFMGSGTTALACIRADRKFIGYELEPKYINLAKHRIGNISAEFCF